MPAISSNLALIQNTTDDQKAAKMLENLLQKMPANDAGTRSGPLDWAILTLGAVLLSVALFGAITGSSDRADVVPAATAANL